jgi:hypothetical protein
MRTSLAEPPSFPPASMHFASRSSNFSTAFFVEAQRKKKLLSIPCLPAPNFRCSCVPFFATYVAPSVGLGHYPPPPPSFTCRPSPSNHFGEKQIVDTTHVRGVTRKCHPIACVQLELRPSSLSSNSNSITTCHTTLFFFSTLLINDFEKWPQLLLLEQLCARATIVSEEESGAEKDINGLEMLWELLGSVAGRDVLPVAEFLMENIQIQIEAVPQGSPGAGPGKAAKFRVYPAKFIVEIQRSKAIPILIAKCRGSGEKAIEKLNEVDGKEKTGCSSAETVTTETATSLDSVLKSITDVCHSSELKFFPRLTSLILSLLHRCVISCSCNALRGEFSGTNGEILVGFGRRRINTPKSTVCSIQSVRFVDRGDGSGDSLPMAKLTADSFIGPATSVNAIIADLLLQLEESPLLHLLADMVLLCLNLSSYSSQELKHQYTRGAGVGEDLSTYSSHKKQMDEAMAVLKVVIESLLLMLGRFVIVGSGLSKWLDSQDMVSSSHTSSIQAEDNQARIQHLESWLRSEKAKKVHWPSLVGDLWDGKTPWREYNYLSANTPMSFVSTPSHGTVSPSSSPIRGARPRGINLFGSPTSDAASDSPGLFATFFNTPARKTQEVVLPPPPSSPARSDDANESMHASRDAMGHSMVGTYLSHLHTAQSHCVHAWCLFPSFQPPPPPPLLQLTLFRDVVFGFDVAE